MTGSGALTIEDLMMMRSKSHRKPRAGMLCMAPVGRGIARFLDLFESDMWGVGPLLYVTKNEVDFPISGIWTLVHMPFDKLQTNSSAYVIFATEPIIPCHVCGEVAVGSAGIWNGGVFSGGAVCSSHLIDRMKEAENVGADK